MVKKLKLEVTEALDRKELMADKDLSACPRCGRRAWEKEINEIRAGCPGDTIDTGYWRCVNCHKEATPEQRELLEQ